MILNSKTFPQPSPWRKQELSELWWCGPSKDFWGRRWESSTQVVCFTHPLHKFTALWLVSGTVKMAKNNFTLGTEKIARAWHHPAETPSSSSCTGRREHTCCINHLSPGHLPDANEHKRDRLGTFPEGPEISCKELKQNWWNVDIQPISSFIQTGWWRCELHFITFFNSSLVLNDLIPRGLASNWEDKINIY